MTPVDDREDRAREALQRLHEDEKRGGGSASRGAFFEDIDNELRITPYDGPDFTPGVRGQGVPLGDPADSTPLFEHENPGDIPQPALWAMKFLRHWHLFHHDTPVIRRTVGGGTGALYIIDDGPKHVMICRRTHPGDDNWLVGCAPLEILEGSAEPDPAEAFRDATETSLVHVFDGGTGPSNVEVRETYAGFDEIPRRYLLPD